MISAILPYGAVLIYGGGYNPGITGVYAPTDYIFGSIYQIANHEIEQAQVGQSVMYKKTDKVTVTFATVQYQVVPESSIKLIETIPT